MDMPVNVPVDDPNADTEWNDILRKHGVIPEKPPSPGPLIEEALNEARRLAHETRLEGKDLDELDELEDEEDEAFLDHYRKKRMDELATLKAASVYNQVYPVQKAEWSSEVTETSQRAWVLVLLTSNGGGGVANVEESRVCEELWRVLADKFGEIKFCQMRADLCIEGYPDRNTPTVLAYREGDVRKQLVTLRELKGARTGVADMERVLLELGAVKRGDGRLVAAAAGAAAAAGGDARHEAPTEGRRGIVNRGKGDGDGDGNDDDDSDWD